jgi:hypothetical protein
MGASVAMGLAADSGSDVQQAESDFDPLPFDAPAATDPGSRSAFGRAMLGSLPAPGRIDYVLTVETITDPDDELIGDYRALTDVELRTQWERPNGLFIAEGELVLRRALRAGYRLRSVLIDSKRVSQIDDLPLQNVPVYASDQAILEAITGFHVHRGVLASFHRKPEQAASQVLASAQRIAIL